VLKTLSKDTKKTLLYIAIAFLFSVAMRLIWVANFSGYEPFYYNGQFMINTNDGYFWAEGARDLLSGTVTNPDAKEYFERFHQADDLSPVSSAPAITTAFFAKILPFSFESIIFYLPVFLSSLLVIPVILIAKDLKNLEMGLIAALLSSVAWSYYNRTMAGYYDTDMLNVVLPIFLLWSIIWAIDTNKNIYLLVTAIDILIYRWWYPQSYSLEFSFFGLILAYTLIFERKNFYNYKLLAIMMFAMMNIDGAIRAALVLAAFFVFKEKKYDKYVFYILAVSIFGFLLSGGLEPIWAKLKIYIFESSVTTSDKGLGLHFFTVMQTVREAGKIPFETFANRISGHTVTFLISLGGYIYLLYKKPIMLFSLPLVGLGFLAYFGGLRFTIYAIVPLAFGIAFLIVSIADKMPTKKLKYLSMLTFTLLLLYPNYKHIDAYRVPTVFNADEVRVLEQLKQKASREDYVVSWWDYGYPVRYYADVKTLTDGGKHSGSVNFPVSYMLTHPQQEAANMARLDVEYTEKIAQYKKQYKEEIAEGNITLFSNIEQMTKDYGFSNTNDFLETLSTKNLQLPQKTRDIYFYLPFRMINIYPTISLFSNIDLMSGHKKKQPFFYVSRNFRDNGEKIQLAQNIFLDKRTLQLTLGKQILPIRRFVKTQYDKNMHLKKRVQLVNLTSDISVIYMANYNTFLIVDETTYNSLFIQLFVLQNYDKRLFEPVVLSPSAVVYKLKI
jgi:dolichyl-diphosphooligosaccharide--protein glycosyltransferase/undecaprenyl-diphosphooligosaccharide--protein glycosyltransferase